MNQKYSDDVKQRVLNLFQSGEPVSSIVSVTNIPRSTIYAWLKQMQNGQSKKEVSVKNFRLLENRVYKSKAGTAADFSHGPRIQLSVENLSFDFTIFGSYAVFFQGAHSI